jgi:hypothetical protein
MYFLLPPCDFSIASFETYVSGLATYISKPAT